MADVNLLTASSIKLQNSKLLLEDDTAIDSASGNVRVVNLGPGQGAKIISLVFRNTSGSTAYAIDVGVSLDDGAGLKLIYNDYSLSANTTWWAITPETPIYLAQNDELRAHGAAGSETNVHVLCSFELLDD